MGALKRGELEPAYELLGLCHPKGYHGCEGDARKFWIFEVSRLLEKALILSCS